MLEVTIVAELMVKTAYKVVITTDKITVEATVVRACRRDGRACSRGL